MTLGRPVEHLFHLLHGYVTMMDITLVMQRRLFSNLQAFPATANLRICAKASCRDQNAGQKLHKHAKLFVRGFNCRWNGWFPNEVQKKTGRGSIISERCITNVYCESI